MKRFAMLLMALVIALVLVSATCESQAEGAIRYAIVMDAEGTAWVVPTSGTAQEMIDEGEAAFGAGIYKVAAGCFWEAARLGSAQAQYALGILYQQGYGVEQSLEKAGEYYRLAADQGHEEAGRALKLMTEEERVDDALPAANGSAIVSLPTLAPTPKPTPTPEPTATPEATAVPQSAATPAPTSVADPGVCSYCYGSGTCSYCYGLGTCDHCFGNGTVMCETCFGSGSCPSCDGFGYIDNYSPIAGIQQIRCGRCSGTGRCTRCGGVGYPQCNYCNGTGACLYCKGSTVCRYCGGTGRR